MRGGMSLFLCDFNFALAAALTSLHSGSRAHDLLGDVVAPEVGRAHVAAGDLDRLVAGLAHHVVELRRGGGGGEAGAQAVARVIPEPISSDPWQSMENQPFPTLSVISDRSELSGIGIRGC